MVEQTLEPTDTKAPAFTAIAATTGATVWGYQTEVSTGIADVKRQADADPTAFFDLNGRRVNTQRKGIYINNGKKFIIR